MLAEHFIRFIDSKEKEREIRMGNTNTDWRYRSRTRDARAVSIISLFVRLSSRVTTTKLQSSRFPPNVLLKTVITVISRMYDSDRATLFEIHSIYIIRAATAIARHAIDQISSRSSVHLYIYIRIKLDRI